MDPRDCRECRGSQTCKYCKGGDFVYFGLDARGPEFVRGCMICYYTGKCITCQDDPGRYRRAEIHSLRGAPPY